MLVKFALRNANTKLIKRFLEIRPVFVISKKYLSQNQYNDCEGLFKCYSDDGGNFGDKYKPLSGDDYDRFISDRAKKREPALTRLVTQLAYEAGGKMVSLAEGMPNEEMFPFSRMQLQLKDGRAMDVEGSELAAALQYVPSQGLPALLARLQEFQELVHRPPPADRRIIVTNGAQQAVYQCLDLLLEPGDPVIISEYAYTGTCIAMKPYSPEILSIPEDSEGIRPEAIEAILQSRLAKGLKMPRLLYTIPTGNNPTGTVLPEDRRRRIYELACEYDFLILEDDPYMFLSYKETIISRLLSDLPSLAAHFLSARSFYKNRRDALHRALCRADATHVAEWTLPDAGLFLWLKVREVDDVYSMVFNTAFQRGLMLIPGHAFLYDSGAPSQHIRLTFSKVAMKDMEAAARTLVAVIRDEQRNAASKRLHRSATT
ncbi:kynurenine/alpha-aminoadipate aminotransferase, mitochondrial isoform X2 [Pectinophora gossypiella]|uniref:kynurenine/alpha-aminoadipate aminotransferase, mitochondrial isoform X2 n=1 Tax=Pectinophora gossypiella TaxID=13191 RepID=UPI00214E1210|nr:kynurenine/alpha-aminoadipate aminotransferase, mitochondrial isoform X2 [Pectinophora gossypiella]